MPDMEDPEAEERREKVVAVEPSVENVVAVDPRVEKVVAVDPRVEKVVAVDARREPDITDVRRLISSLRMQELLRDF